MSGGFWSMRSSVIWPLTFFWRLRGERRAEGIFRHAGTVSGGCGASCPVCQTVSEAGMGGVSGSSDYPVYLLCFYGRLLGGYNVLDLNKYELASVRAGGSGAGLPAAGRSLFSVAADRPKKISVQPAQIRLILPVYSFTALRDHGLVCPIRSEAGQPLF